jgi:hypothetical protein
MTSAIILLVVCFIITAAVVHKLSHKITDSVVTKALSKDTHEQAIVDNSADESKDVDVFVHNQKVKKAVAKIKVTPAAGRKKSKRV